MTLLFVAKSILSDLGISPRVYSIGTCENELGAGIVTVAFFFSPKTTKCKEAKRSTLGNRLTEFAQFIGSFNMKFYSVINQNEKICVLMGKIFSICS